MIFFSSTKKKDSSLKKNRQRELSLLTCVFEEQAGQLNFF